MANRRLLKFVLSLVILFVVLGMVAVIAGVVLATVTNSSRTEPHRVFRASVEGNSARMRGDEE